jgi:hypothetical protein
MAAHLIGTETMPVRSATWYRKACATFAETIALVRRCVWGQCDFSPSAAAADAVHIPRSLFERCTDALCYAAYLDKVELRYTLCIDTAPGCH